MERGRVGSSEVVATEGGSGTAPWFSKESSVGESRAGTWDATANEEAGDRRAPDSRAGGSRPGTVGAEESQAGESRRQP